MEWLTYGSGYLAGVKMGNTPLADFTRDRLHRETQRTFGAYELATAYTPAGQLRSQAVNNPQLNREYGYDDSGQLIRIRGTYQEMYHYDDAGRLISARHHNQLQRYLTDPAGNR
ncbi:TPA: hypothetical protein O8L90_004711, partial [Enterobacter cloacae]|nr:hypothetical protein [Enterobacter cloacae]